MRTTQTPRRFKYPRPDRHRLRATAPATGVDRGAGVIRGYVVAKEGVFKSERGEFDYTSLSEIVALMNAAPAGLKSRFTHPDASNDGLGSFLGRARDARMSAHQGRLAVRADLHLAAAAFASPRGNLGRYVMDLAEEDPDALSSSLVLAVRKERQLDDRGRPLVGDDGEEVPPLWRPTRLHASDVVDTGDAVDGLLSAGIDVDGLPLAALWRAGGLLDAVAAGHPPGGARRRLLGVLDGYLSGRPPAGDAEGRAHRLLDSVFAGQDPGVTRVRCEAWLDRALGRPPAGSGEADRLRRRLRLRELEGR